MAPHGRGAHARSRTSGATRTAKRRRSASAKARVCPGDTLAPPSGSPGRSDITITGASTSVSRAMGLGARSGACSMSRFSAAHSRSASPSPQEVNRLRTIGPLNVSSWVCGTSASVPRSPATGRDEPPKSPVGLPGRWRRPRDHASTVVACRRSWRARQPMWRAFVGATRRSAARWLTRNLARAEARDQQSPPSLVPRQLPSHPR